MNAQATSIKSSSGQGLRHVTILFSDIADLSGLTEKLGDMKAAELANELLTLQEVIITRDGAGQVLQYGGDSIFAVFSNASAALNRALEIQRVLALAAARNHGAPQPQVRLGLHTGEVLLREGERIEVISRHVNRARRVMDAAAPGQVLASEAVVEAGKDFIDIPKESLTIQYYGEYYLKGAGVTGLCEVCDTRWREPEAPRRGRKLESALAGRLELAGYKITGKLGEGAHGVVYAAIAEQSGREVAIKVLNPLLCQDLGARQQFIDEVERMRGLESSLIPKIIDERLDHQPPFFVMERLHGQPLDAALAGADPKRIAAVFRDACSLLSKAHASGLLHRDLKPGNLLLLANDRPVLLDFGVSLLRSPVNLADKATTSTAHYFGTPAYCAPEVLQGGAATARSDIYSIGVLLFEVLTGRPPFQHETIHEIVQAHLHEDPPLLIAVKPDIPDALQRVCLKALEKNPGARYQTMAELVLDLERFLRSELVRTRPTLYDNLLYHRVQAHAEQVQDWAAKGLLTSEESRRLLSCYEELQRRGLPAVMEGRRYRFWQTLVYLGAWAVINGALLWLIQDWNNFSRTEKLALGSIPGLMSFALAGAMWKLERYRLTYVAFIMAIIATPLLAGVWVYELDLFKPAGPLDAKYELLFSGGAKFLTNQQLYMIGLATFLSAAGIMLSTSTRTHSLQALIAFVLAYLALLLPFGLQIDYEEEKWALLAIKLIPLCWFSALIARALLNSKDRVFQATPWVYFATLLFGGICTALALYALPEWTVLDQQMERPLSLLLLAACGLVEVVAGLWLRDYLQHRCRLAGGVLISAGLISLLAGLVVAGDPEIWPEGWTSHLIFGQRISSPHWLLPILSAAITLLACRYQLFSFLSVGVIGFGLSIYLLGYRYFESEQAWPKALMITGGLCFFAALALELKRSRGNSMDDLVIESRL